MANLSRALLLTVGLMLALSTVGIDLSALSVLGGAVGVGIGFGLQKPVSGHPFPAKGASSSFSA